MKKNILTYIILVLLCTGLSCKKSFLEDKPNAALLVPQSYADLQAMLDNTYIINVAPSLQILAGDEFSTDASSLANYATPPERNIYTWNNDPYEGATLSDWNMPYKQIFYANIVIETLNQMPATEQSSTAWRSLKGSALFYRALAYYHLAQLFCPAYQSTTAANSFGLALHLKSDVNDHPQRSNLYDTYHQILTDLLNAQPLLPKQVAYKSRPGYTAALALLARVYQTMGDHPKAAEMANAALAINNKLIDYNTITTTVTATANPFPPVLPNANDEVIFYTTGIGYSFFGRTLVVEKSLFDSYALNDLRKPVYFVDRGNGVVNVKGHYGGSTGAFFGLANDELYLILAESQARAGKVAEAMASLNILLATRFKKGSYTALTANTTDEALAIILQERKKTLIRRGLRWADLKRLNLEDKTATVVTKVVNGKVFILIPGDGKYVFEVPRDEGDMQQ